MKNKVIFEEFQERSNKVHNSKYIYHKDTFVNTHKNTTITCPIHRDFQQTPHSHMSGQGCPKCGKEYAMTWSKNNYSAFVNKTKNLYGNSFSFPNIEREYENNKSRITIRCNKCGYEFTKRPNDFLNYKVFKGCKNCRHNEYLKKRKQKLEEIKKLKASMPKKVKKPSITPEIYLERFRKRFGNTIEPYMDEYVDTQKEIHFKCAVCGHVFSRRPSGCLSSKGCPKCHDPHNTKLTNEIFEEKGKIIHNNKYDYSESDYKNTDTKVKVICHELDEFGKEHGAFWVTPHAHIGMMKSGCPKCSNKFGSGERFIKLATRKYNGLYDYNNFVYNGAFKESYVTCKIHGDFLVSPNRHLNGQMCPKCVGSAMEKEISALLDENNIEHYMRKHFDWLGKQELDIFIPKYNIAIECQGGHHFIPIDLYGGEDEFKYILENDKRKRKLCEKNGIKLLYYSNLGIKYPYFVFENKEELLKEIIK